MIRNRGAWRHVGNPVGSRCFVLALVIGVCGIGPAALADQAVVIGVNEYANLSPNLEGCVHDADLIGNVLHGRQFEIVPLVNKAATKAGIVAALAKIKRTIKPDERFVFYFAGHGAQNGYIVPHDAKIDGENCLTREELRKLIADIPARSRTIILDACFSETMIQKGGIGLDQKVRGIVLKNIPAEQSRATDAGFDAARPQGPDNAADVPDKADICYWTAASREQPAIEAELPTSEMIAEMKANKQTVPAKIERHGVFSYFAALELSKRNVRWGDMNTRVRQRIQSVLQAKQWPIVSKDFTDTPIFETNAPPILPKPVKHTLWEEFARDRADAKMLRLEVKPDKAVVHNEELFGFSIHPGMEGYLVIISQNDQGRLHLVYPTESFSVEDARVSAGAEQNFDMARFTEEGSFHVRALLFASKSRASKLLAAFGSKRDIQDAGKAGEKDLELGRATTELPYTADLMFQVLPAQAAPNK